MMYESYGVNHELFFRKGAYHDKTLAIQIMCKTEGEDYIEPFARLTVNLGAINLPENCAFFDANNCPQQILMNLIEEGVATMTTTSAQSGYCTYPLVKFSDEWLASLERI